MSKRVYLFANGDMPQTDRLKSEITAEALIFCADGGARHALSLGLVPDLVVGDLDSLTEIEIARLHDLGCQIEQHPVDKDATDLELALVAVQQRQLQEVVLVGGLGGRLDQSLANLLLLAGDQFSDLNCSVIDGDRTAWIMRDHLQLAGAEGDIVSVLALTPMVEGLTYSKGLRWPLTDAKLPFGSSRGISNEMTGAEVRLSLHKGTLLVIHTPAS